MKRLELLCLIAALLFGSCKNAGNPTALSNVNTVEAIHQIQDELTQIIIYDVFTPPVASRIYTYSSLAGYEAIRFLDTSRHSLVAHMNYFGPMPVPDKNKQYDFGLAYIKAFATVAEKVIFSKDTMRQFSTSLIDKYKAQLTETVFDASIDFGQAVADSIWIRGAKDHYLSSRGKPKYLGSDAPGQWRPTPPDYLDGIEFCWNEIDALTLDSASQFLPPPPPSYTMDSGSVFYNMVREVYDIQQNLTEEQRIIARFWDDNPFVIEHSGHMMFGNKKITPGGHWMGIAAIASRQTGADAVKTALTYALTASALFDAFISSWDAKYKWNYIRPITVIHEYWQKDWNPMLQTPPFPEYTSGHSTITAAAATALTHLYGPSFAFNDTSELRYIGMQRQFESFIQASDECSVSRLYGGIHYRLSVDEGAVAGKLVGQHLIKRVGLH